MRGQIFRACAKGAITPALVAAFTLGNLFNVAASAKELKVGNITIKQPWSRATPKGAPVGVGYLKLTNTGKEADRLVSGTTTVAARVEIHQMKMDGGVMRMRRMVDGLTLPPGKTVELKPGGYHLMLMKLSTALQKGRPFTATLQFERAGAIEVQFNVEAIGAAAPGAGKSGSHSGSKHKNH